MRYLILALGLISLQACTTAGPFVANISPDGRGGLHIEKCMVHMNAFMGTVSTSDCSSQHIYLGVPEK